MLQFPNGELSGRINSAPLNLVRKRLWIFRASKTFIVIYISRIYKCGCVRRRRIRPRRKYSFCTSDKIYYMKYRALLYAVHTRRAHTHTTTYHRYTSGSTLITTALSRYSNYKARNKPKNLAGGTHIRGEKQGNKKGSLFRSKKRVVVFRTPVVILLPEKKMKKNK